jgi:formylglycine-generating enzyme
VGIQNFFYAILIMVKSKCSNYIFCELVLLLTLYSCNNTTNNAAQISSTATAHSCMNVPARFGTDTSLNNISFSGDTTVAGMALIPAGEFDMGGDNNQADPDELPKHRVKVSSFYMDITEVTNAQFKKFVEATKYITTAERKPDWEEMKKTVPPGTPKPDDNLLVAASLIF